MITTVAAPRPEIVNYLSALTPRTLSDKRLIYETKLSGIVSGPLRFFETGKVTDSLLKGFRFGKTLHNPRQALGILVGRYIDT